MKKFILVSGFMFFLAAAIKPVQAVSFPIPELGNCQSKSDCKSYCDKPENVAKCSDYGVAHGLMTAQDARRAKAISQTSNGPGGCKDMDSCSSFCDRPENVSSCLDYASKHNLMSSDDLDKARKVASVITGGGSTPGGCRTPQSCKSYCDNDSHRDECIGFAQRAGLISAQEAAGVNGMGDKLKNGGPGGCKTKEQCAAYCQDQAHGEECAKFFGDSGDHGQPPPEGDKNKPPKGNGGAVCSTIEECKAFCANPANAEACKNVVIKDGGQSGPEKSGDIGKLRDNFAQMPEESQNCIRQTIGSDNYDLIMSGQMPKTAINSDSLQSCFAQGVQEHEQKLMPTKKPDDSDMGGPLPEQGQQQEQPEGIRPAATPEVKGVSTGTTLWEKIREWIGF
ncbi:hypothetical protein M1116_01470 [Patescibacteria group bacterium]|nr:hypothetical protein [Patescibacteria group bacterium]